MSSRSSGVSQALTKMIREMQLMKTLEPLIGQPFSSGEFMKDRKNDPYLFMNVETPEQLISLIYMDWRGDEKIGNVRAAKFFVERWQRGSGAIGGARMDDLIQIVIGLMGGSSNKVVQRKSWLKRNVTERGQPEFEEKEVS